MPTHDSESDYWVCPHCGADLAPRAGFCRECGASEDSGWNESEAWAEPNLGDSDDPDFDYDEFIAREFPEHAKRRAHPPSLKSTVALIVVVLLIALLLFGSFF
jgi:hypothetical protein